MNPIEQLIDYFLAMLLVTLMVGCAAPRVVVEKEEATCSVPSTVIQPVEIPAKLVAGATNEDLRNREQALEGRLEICNARLADVPKAIRTTKPEPQKPADPTWAERLFGIFRRSP